MKKHSVSIIDFAEDPNLLGVELYPEQRRILLEFWEGDYTLGLLALGRRSGKTMLAAISASYCATVLSDQYREHLRSKERWFSLAIATNLEQSKIFLSMVRDMLESSPILRPMILRSTAEQIELVNGCVFRSIPSSGRGSRGMAVGFWVMNPTLSTDFLEEQKVLLGQEVFGAEYGAEWTSSLSAFLPSELIDAAINHDRGPLPPLPNFQGRYYLSLDPARGGRDDYTACIIHFDGDRLVVDKWHEFKPSWQDGKKTQVAIAEVEDWILEHHELYGFALVVLDQYNSQSTIQRLRGRLPIEELTKTAPTKTKAFSRLREIFNAQNIELYPHPKGIQQLKNLIVQYRPNGTWNVTGGTGAAVDDYALALAGAVLVAQDSDGWNWLQIYSMH